MRRRWAIGLVLLGANTAAAQGTATGAFAPLDHGARGAAMAGACVADPGDAESMTWNPAGLAFLRSGHLRSSYADLYGLGLVRHLHLAVSGPHGALGAGALEVRQVSIGGFDPPEGPDALESPTYRETSYGYGYARMLRDRSVALGIAMRLETASGSLESTDDADAIGLATDVGLLIHVTDRFRLGLQLRNAAAFTQWTVPTGGTTTERQPSTVAAGFAWRTPMEGLRFVGALESGEAIADGPFGATQRLALGSEWSPFDERLALRGGLGVRGPKDAGRTFYSAGIGSGADGLGLDYAFTSDEDGLGSTHRFGLHLQW